MFRKKNPVARKLIDKLHSRLGNDLEVINPGPGRCQGILIKDPYYIHYGNPGHREHDELGFRNKKVPEQASVICIGDSQTYGILVQSDESWPAQLAEITNTTVYNAGIGGWGSFQYALIADELLSLQPKHVILGLTLVTDIAEAFLHTKTSASPLAKKFWKSDYEAHALSLSPDQAILDQHVRDCYAKNMSRVAALELGERIGIPNINPCTIHGAKYYLQDKYRFPYQDLRNEAVQSGLEITQNILLYLRDLSHNFGFQLHVVPIPSKEQLIYLRREEAEIQDRASALQIGENEVELTKLICDFCESIRLDCINPVSILAENVENLIFKEKSDDGHFSALGYKLLAHYIQHHIQLEDYSTHDAAADIYPMY